MIKTGIWETDVDKINDSYLYDELINESKEFNERYNGVILIDVTYLGYMQYSISINHTKPYILEGDVFTVELRNDNNDSLLLATLMDGNDDEKNIAKAVIETIYSRF